MSLDVLRKSKMIFTVLQQNMLKNGILSTSSKKSAFDLWVAVFAYPPVVGAQASERRG